ncbi:MAG: HAD family phosphatase [Candidatus Omnitrophota bacterium]
MHKTKPCKTRVVIFDLGNVLINFDLRRATRKLAKYSNLREAEILRTIRKSTAIIAHEKGLMSDRDFFLHIKRDLDLAISRDDFEKIWSDIFWENRSVGNIAKKLKARRYTVAIISDTNPLHNRRELVKFPVIRRIADYYFPSFAMKTRKAEGPKIFRLVIRKLKISPCEAVFIDDLPSNIRHARLAGMRAIRFRNSGQLKNALAKEGVNI